MKKWLFGSAVLMLAALVTVTASAQRPQFGGGFGGGFGRGGFGGDPIVGLLRVDAVLTEIEALDEQKEQIAKVMEESRGERSQVNFRELSEEERNKFFADMRAQSEKRSAEARKKLDAILLPHQLKRLKEISLQQRGVQALTDAEVAKEVGLDEKQQQKLNETAEKTAAEMGEKMRELFQSGDREGMREKMQALRSDADKQLLALLSTDQQAKFESMKGEKFEMPERTFGGRGGDNNRPGGDNGQGRRGNRRPGSDNQ
ncbi:MAG: hypothetical protein R3C99_28465 [Pirellulaceae bacterium]